MKTVMVRHKIIYSSFYDFGEKAQSELDRLIETGRADKVSTWEEVVALVGPQAKLMPLACLVKRKDCKEKVCLVVDMPQVRHKTDVRIFDVSLSVQELFKIKTPYEQLEFLVIDFSDVG